MAKHTLGEQAPAAFKGRPADLEAGGTFEFDYTEDELRALVAAGWIEPSDKKKGEK